ncbi:sporulation protein [Sphingomonas spermidinifaciens]|uniref:Sporulation protein n=1 Tax=Sphingomonas spermidinifaciens TaxID=1141889 RepID=A0A2A4B431_9SPHN|nr:SPOR domain-containing protein [Sphingomonas spermidinifaciens]PCD03953.1 sporulation protein [Sphingomonas spermidinifaciens]
MAPAADDAALAEEDRLPWLETVEERYEEGAPMGRVILLVVLGLAIIAAAIAGLYWWQDRAPSTGGGSGELINAAEGDYKVKPDEVGGMQVAGEGDSVFKTSDGGQPSNASVDLSAVPEAPLATGARPAPKAAPTPVAGAARVSEAVPPPGRGDAPAGKAGVRLPPVATGGAGGAIVQLGSFPTTAAANAAWKQLSGRFGYLAGLGQSIEAAEVNGRTVQRLRVNTGSNAQAREVCGKLKVAGEACFVVAN